VLKMLDAGDRILLSGSSAEEVQQALDRQVERGAKVVTPPCQVGRTWTAACTLPPKAGPADDTTTLSLAEIEKAAVQAATYDTNDGCRIEELGLKRMVFGPSRVAVERRIEYLRQFGAQLLGEIEQIDEEWVAVLDMGAGSAYRK
jgi:hypothetical protein